MLSFSPLIGNHFIATDHDAGNRADVLELALKRVMWVDCRQFRQVRSSV
jgi:hypothetical protein